ncbi:OLC1v1021787C1 [Oldenlandia corymbosa var. corymbosa]|uniref:OLC1v1021787C1 n=1 Tax=Oldenlandia corymbosa var. corymbosa TaxID=529605 RepID=A0AAV1BZ01_OLDCO|nr:OLC1v1021787C1 [Oldenlandia corymbosa var. corymbosa]
MAGVTENFLLDKLDQAFEDTKSTEHFLFSVLFDVQSDFRKLKEKLQPNAGISPAQRKENLYYLNNLLSEWQLLLRSQSIYSPEGLNSAYKLSKRVKKIKKDLKIVASGAATADAADLSAQKNLDTYRWSSRTVDPSKVYGLGDKERFLERMLPEDDEDKRKEVIKRMLMCLGVDDDIIEKAGEDVNFGIERLIFALRLQLKGNKYLIVLDDAWNSDKCFEDLHSDSLQDESSYEKLAYGLPKGHGGTVVITTRSKEIAAKMVGEENLHQLPILKDRESCWKIFKDSVELGGRSEFPEELTPLKDLIVDKCAGLPLAAKMMGEIMHQQLLQNPIQNQIQQNRNQQQSQHSTV